MTTENAMRSFKLWIVFIEDNRYGINDENGNMIAYKMANTSPLKMHYKYTIHVQNGVPHIWVEPGINMPFFIELDIVSKIPRELWNTPLPSLMIGNRKMNSHAIERIL